MHYYPDDAPSARRIIRNYVPFELVDKQRILDRDNWKCTYCHRTVELVGPTPTSDDFTRATLDHVVPISLGGSHTYSNIVTACSDCNSIKGNDPELVDIALLLRLVTGPP